MAQVIGLGGTFLRSRDPEALYAWYEKHLGLTRQEGCFIFPAAGQRAYSVLAFFSREDSYWSPAQPVMVNLQVDDLDAVLDRLLAGGIDVDPKRESYSYGRFGWFVDPDGNRVELWQPAS
jgi:predicted enzyme related to lactoylglutathione lyase